MTSWPTTGMDVSDVVDAAMASDPSPASAFDAVVAPLESTKVSTTARVVAMAAAPTTPAANDVRRARRRCHRPAPVRR